MPKREFVQRRKMLMQQMGDNTIAILPAAPVRIRNRDVEYRYRPDSDFFYLTGFHEPEAVAVIIPRRKHGEYILFCRERDPEMETWHGYRAGLEGAQNEYGAEDAFPISDIDEILPGLLENREKVYYAMGCDPEFDQQVMKWINRLRSQSRSGTQVPNEYIALDHMLHDMRLYKSRAEIKMMRRAGEISAKAHCQAMKTTRPGKYEYQIESELQYVFAQEGARSEAYPSIVGAGGNGCVLHYTENNMAMNEGDLLLIDAAAEYNYYAADITRTFPVNGKFTPPQQQIYEIVLAAQYAAIEQVKPGNHWNDPHEAAIKAITQGLVDVGILKGNVKKLIEKEAYKRFYMHRTGHWLGMDVHDVGDYKVGDVWRMLEPGMMMTIEPGLYIPADSKGVAKKWWNIGIRIEDDVLVTEDGCEVFTDGVPKEVAEIEALMAEAG
jgi:Xaa-Pro aminopeptidase